MLRMRRFAERTPDPGQKTETKIVWLRLKVFCFSKDIPTGHRERKKKRRQTEEEVGRQYQRVDRNDFASSTRAAESRTWWKGIVANSSVVPRRIKIASKLFTTLRLLTEIQKKNIGVSFSCCYSNEWP